MGLALGERLIDLDSQFALGVCRLLGQFDIADIRIRDAGDSILDIRRFEVEAHMDELGLR